MKENYRLLTVDGKSYVCISLERDENSVTELEKELHKRIVRIRFNIEKCGSYDKLREIGGTATERYLMQTRNMVRHFILQTQLEFLLTTEEDIREAVQNSNSCDAETLVRKASWEDVTQTAELYRDSLVKSWFRRNQAIA